MADGTTTARRPLWLVLVIGGVVGAALGVVPSATTDIPLAPEVGLAIGLAAGWGVSRMRG